MTQVLKRLKIPTKYKYLFEPDKKVTIIVTKRRPRIVVLKRGKL